MTRLQARLWAVGFYAFLWGLVLFTYLPGRPLLGVLDASGTVLVLVAVAWMLERNRRRAEEERREQEREYLVTRGL